MKKQYNNKPQRVEGMPSTWYCDHNVRHMTCIECRHTKICEHELKLPDCSECLERSDRDIEILQKEKHDRWTKKRNRAISEKERIKKRTARRKEEEEDRKNSNNFMYHYNKHKPAYDRFFERQRIEHEKMKIAKEKYELERDRRYPDFRFKKDEAQRVVLEVATLMRSNFTTCEMATEPDLVEYFAKVCSDAWDSLDELEEKYKAEIKQDEINRLENNRIQRETRDERRDIDPVIKEEKKKIKKAESNKAGNIKEICEICGREYARPHKARHYKTKIHLNHSKQL